MTLTGVAVVGSANLDVVMHLDRFAGPGETVLGERLEHVVGGKGLNQAVAASRTTRCCFVGCVGDDEAAGLVRRRLTGAGVDDTHVTAVPDPTGRAFIQVTPDGENSIVVLPLANHALSADRVKVALDAATPAVVLTQLEIPLESVRAAADWTAQQDARLVLNPSPVQHLPPEVLARCDPLVLNVGEARALLETARTAGAAPVEDEPVTVARRLLTIARSAVVTAGAAGAAVASRLEGEVRVPGVPAVAVDTTGAGDEFAGSLAAALANGAPLAEAARLANEAAARLVAMPRGSR